MPLPISAQAARQLSNDHRFIRALLDDFARVDDLTARKESLRLACDLFCVTHEFELRLGLPFGLEADRSLRAMTYLMEQLETTDPRSRLYYARGMELKKLVDQYIERQHSAGNFAARAANNSAEADDWVAPPVSPANVAPIGAHA